MFVIADDFFQDEVYHIPSFPMLKITLQRLTKPLHLLKFVLGLSDLGVFVSICV